ncbi:Protochlorophyllide reductase A-like protein [Lachnellula subtilissima]|uniref:Protochlorophyllide reductase A-like protein n=1 Tax=Lachnellula subtilissima TaxID=602034 RepID=A0A8H8RRS6_9HELO|nr:Protochlorophyllide reductase A-like protein [Lachnellula subtilissima]
MAAAKGTVIVTGANGGLGSAIAKQLVSQPEFVNYHGIYLVRDANSAAELDSALATSSSHPHDVLSMDLTDLDSVRKTAKSVNLRVSAGDIPQIKTLILNAGFQDFGKQTWTKDGFDTTFSANYLGHWLLTILLLESMDKESGRVVLVGSQAHDPHDKRNDQSKAFVDEKYKTVFDDQAGVEAIAKGHWSSAQEDPSWRSGFRRYGASKLFLIMMMHELQHRMDQDPILKKCLHTGRRSWHYEYWSNTTCFMVILPLVTFFMPDGPIHTTQKSASHILQAAFDSNQVLGQSPKDVYLNGVDSSETSDESRDVRKRDLVWKESVRYTGLKKGETVLQKWE